MSFACRDIDNSLGNCCRCIYKQAKGLSLRREHEMQPTHYPTINHCAIDKNSRIFYVQVNNQGSSDEWVGVSITYYRQTNSGPGYQMIGSDSLQGAVDGTRTSAPGEIQHAGGYDRIHTHQEQSYYIYGSRVPDDAKWIVYCMPWYYDSGNHGWTDFNGPGGESDRCHVCVVS